MSKVNDIINDLDNIEAQEAFEILSLSLDAKFMARTLAEAFGRVHTPDFVQDVLTAAKCKSFVQEEPK